MIKCLPALRRKPNDTFNLNPEIGARAGQAVTRLILILWFFSLLRSFASFDFAFWMRRSISLSSSTESFSLSWSNHAATAREREPPKKVFTTLANA